MSPTYVQSATSSPFVSGTSASATYGSNVTKGNLLVCASQTNLTSDATTISDTQGSVWTHLINQPSPSTPPGTEGDLWFAIAKSSGSNTVTVHSSVAAYIGAVVAEYSGVNAVDGTALGNQSEASSQNFITSAAAEVLIAFFSCSGSVETMGGGFTLLQSISLADVVYFVFGEYIVASKGTYAATCNALIPEWSVIAGFKKLNGAGLLLGVG